MLEFQFDTQLLIEGENLDEDEIHITFSKTSPATVSLPPGTRS